MGGVASARPLRRGRLGVGALISAPVVFAIEFVSVSFARALFVWFYDVTASSVLLLAIFHASFDASISQLSDIVRASNTARFVIFSAVIVLAATTVIIATQGWLG